MAGPYSILSGVEGPILHSVLDARTIEGKHESGAVSAERLHFLAGEG
jgi:hypothetical protein